MYFECPAETLRKIAGNVFPGMAKSRLGLLFSCLTKQHATSFN